MKENQKAPDFTLPDQDGNKVSLRGFKGKWVVLYFYPKDNTPGCTIEAKEFTKALPQFRKLNAVVVGCSPDSEQSHCRFIEKQGLKLTLLADEEKEVLKRYGAWGKKKFMGREFDGVIRSTFLISPDQRIVKVWSPVKVKGHVDGVLGTLKKL